MIYKDNSPLDRLFQAKTVVFVGGKDIITPIKEIKRRGFEGTVWVVNPNKDEISGYPCYKNILELPGRPDAAFIAVPAMNVINVLKELNEKDCGGVVCYSAGFKETGKDGVSLEKKLVEAAGKMPLIGPNCYGFVNYIDNVALWPFAHGGFSPGWGAAIITQSGMLSSDITMTQRSIPLSYMISLGNQAKVSVEDLIIYFCSKNAVTSIGIHVEGLNDVEKFSNAASFALKLGKPIVAFKTGTSKIGKGLTQSHTGSLSGNDEAYSALFKRLGIIQVNNATQFLETTKFMSFSKPVKNNKVLAFTCSGGGATMVADYGERIGLKFPKFSQNKKKKLQVLLPPIATVSNPLDYTTPIWGYPERTLPVFSEALENSSFGSAMVVQDFPAADLNESESFYWNDSVSFSKSGKNSDTPMIVCSTFPDNIGKKIGQNLVEVGLIPMQGINETLNALHTAFLYNISRQKKGPIKSLSKPLKFKKSVFLNEYHAKQLLKAVGICTPKMSKIIAQNQLMSTLKVSYPIAIKYSHPNLLHKTEEGAVKTNILNENDFKKELDYIKNRAVSLDKRYSGGIIFAEEMYQNPIAELFISFRNDISFGRILVVGIGGTYAEILSDTRTILLPVSRKELLFEIKSLKGYQMLDGYRNQLKVNKNKLLSDIFALIAYFLNDANNCISLEINPLFVYENSTVVIDCVMEKKSA